MYVYNYIDVSMKHSPFVPNKKKNWISFRALCHLKKNLKTLHLGVDNGVSSAAEERMTCYICGAVTFRNELHSVVWQWW